MKQLLDHTLRGFGQMLVANSRVTGVCVFIGLLCLSVESALLSLGGALLISVLARWRAQDDTVLKTGLFSVNGALLGALWLLFPQVPLWAQIVTTAAVRVRRRKAGRAGVMGCPCGDPKAVTLASREASSAL